MHVCQSLAQDDELLVKADLTPLDRAERTAQPLTPSSAVRCM